MLSLPELARLPSILYSKDLLILQRDLAHLQRVRIFPPVFQHALQT